MRFFTGSIRKNLIVLVLLAVLPALGIILYTGLESRKHAIVETEQKALLLAGSMAELQERTANDLHQLLTILSKTNEVQEVRREATSALLKNALALNPVLLGISIADLKGDFIASALPFDKVNIADRGYFQDALHKKNFVAGEYIVGRITKVPSFAFALPIADDLGRPKGVIITTIKLDIYSALFMKAGLPEGSAVTIMDRNGIRMFRHPAKETLIPIGKPVNEPLLEFVSGTQRHGITTQSGHDGVRRIYGYAQIRLKPEDSPYLYIYVGIPEKLVMADANRHLYRNLAFLTLATLLALALASSIWSLTIGKVIARLISTTAKVGKGDLTARTGLDSHPGELGQLARSIEGMTAELAEDAEARRQAEEALAESEERIRAIFNATSDSIILMDTHGTILAINEHGARRRNLRPSEIVGKVLCDYLQPEIAKTRTAKVREIVRTGRPLSFEEERDGRHYLLKMYPVFDQTGKVIQLASFSRDITEHKQDQEALAKSEEKFRTVADYTYDWEYWHGPDGRLVWMSPSCELVTGYTVEEFMADPGLLRRLVHPEDVPVFNGHMREVTGGSIESCELDFRIVHRSGETVWLNHYCLDISRPDGTPLGRRASNRDITARKTAEQALRESEARFRLLVEQAPEAILVHDVGLDRFVDANANAERLFGCPRNDLLQFGPLRFYAPNQPDARPVPESFQNHTKRALAGETVVFERAIRNAQGKALLCEVRLVRLPSAERGLLRASFIDITGRKELEAQLFQAQKLEAVGQLIAGIAHEINTPTQYVADNTRFLKTSFADIVHLFGMVKEVLAAARQGRLSGEIAERLAQALDTLDVDFLEKEVPQAIEQTLEGIERISTIVKSVRRFAHPSKELKEPNDLNEAIRTTITVSRNEWRYVAELRADLDEGLPLVPCVVGEINQVVLNLIVNAAHAIAEKRKEMPDSIGLIIVTTRRTGPWAEIRVQDTGAGIPEEVRPRVFDPFFTTKEIGKGTGQGLAIARKVVVEKHQGTIFFETVPGQGTTFVARLPLEAQLREAS